MTHEKYTPAKSIGEVQTDIHIVSDAMFSEELETTIPPQKSPIIRVVAKTSLTVLLCIFGFVAFIVLAALSRINPENISTIIKSANTSKMMSIVDINDEVIDEINSSLIIDIEITANHIESLLNCENVIYYLGSEIEKFAVAISNGDGDFYLSTTDITGFLRSIRSDIHQEFEYWLTDEDFESIASALNEQVNLQDYSIGAILQQADISMIMAFMLFSVHPLIIAGILSVFFLLNIFLLQRKRIRTAFLSIAISLLLAGLAYIIASLFVGPFSGIFGDAARYIRIFPGLTIQLLIPGLILVTVGMIPLAAFFIIRAIIKNKTISFRIGNKAKVWHIAGLISNGVLLVILLAFILLCYLDARKIDVNVEGMFNLSEESTNIEILNYEYRDDVVVINRVPEYSVIEKDNVFIVTIYNPTDEIKNLSVGETFAFDATIQNSDGLAGHIISIVNDAENIVINASIPKSLEEIFDEFEFIGDINLLADAIAIDIDEELENVAGIEFARNPTRLFEARFSNANVGGVVLNGKLTMLTPRLNVSLSLSGVNHLVVTMAAEINVNTSSQLSVDRVINLFTIPVSFYGVRVEIPVGLRIKANGQGYLEFDCRVNAQFGIRNNKASAQVNVRHTFNYHYNARVELTINVQAKASIFLIPIYGIQGDFGMGARTDSEMQKGCPDSNCFIVGLFHVRRISSLDWGALGWIRTLRFNESLVSDEITNFRYISNGNWHNNCPHDDSAPIIDDSFQPPQPDIISALGEPVTLEEAQKRPGLYVKEGDNFLFVEPQFGNTIRGIHAESTSSSVLLPVLYDADFEIPQIPNNVQFVLIGIRNIAIYEVFDEGWTIPVGFDFWDETRGYTGGWLKSSARSELLDYNRGNIVNWVNQKFEEINGRAPSNYVNRMIYTGYEYNLASTHGVLSASKNEEFTFSWMYGTEWVERTYVADKRFYLLPVSDWVAIQANYEVVETRNGYFEVNFLTRPVGNYAIGSSRRNYEMIVEFVP
ncbi:MAG: hypothetical protein FWD44_06075 [Oscillospiraceae bacterium]|nr:hypothetical protein [Oscillospiraceae bacterium]